MNTENKEFPNSERPFNPFFHRKRSWRMKIPIIILVFAAAIGLFGYIVMILWNLLIPVLFHGPVISFWQGVGILVLTRILFHGFLPAGRNWGRRGRQEFRQHWKDKWEKIPPEQRAKMREAWQKRCGGDFWAPWDQPGPKTQEGGPSAQTPPMAP